MILLTARMLDDVLSVNSYRTLFDGLEVNEGAVGALHFQLVDASVDTVTDGFGCLPGRRYMAASGATLQVTLDNVDDDKKVVRAATQPYPTTDPSIWKIDLLSTDHIRGTMTMRLKLTEGSVVTKGSVRAAIRGRQCKDT